MCGRCITLTYDEVADVVRQIEVGIPIGVEPDWPAQYPQAYPKSVVPLILNGAGVAAAAAPAVAASEMAAAPGQLQLFVGEKTWDWFR